MKTLLLLLLTCLPLWAATTYPMLSDTTNRIVTGGVTNLSFLNSNSVFTGTARWMGIATLTNTGNIFVGDGSGLTGVGMVTSGGLATNATIYGLTINTGSTNNALTGSRAMVTDANKGIISSATTATELGYVSGVTSALQTQIDAKAATSTLGGYVTNLGGLSTNLTATGLTVATGQTNTHLTASSIVTTDANKGIVSGTTTANLATLSANQTFTGTNNFSVATKIDGYEVYVPRVLLVTNVGFFSTITNISAGLHTAQVDNGLRLMTKIFEVALPAVGTNAAVAISTSIICSNANFASTSFYFYVGDTTNYITGFNSTTAAGQVANASVYNRSIPTFNGTTLFFNDGSHTNQYPGATFPFNSTASSAFKVDTSTNGWRLMGGLATQAADGNPAFTNWNLVKIVITTFAIP